MPASKKKVDFRGIKDRSPFRPKHLPEGEYTAVVKDAEDHESESGNTGWVFTLAITNGRGRGAKYPYYCMVNKKNQLWKLRNLLTAAGLNVPKKLVNVDPNKAVGKKVGIVLEDDEYEGRTRSAIQDVIPLSELNDPEAEDFEPEDDEEVEAESDDEIEVEEDELEELEIEEL